MAQRRVLLIDNDPVFESQARDQLQARGLQVLSVAEGQAGLEAVKSNNPDAVVVAAELSGMSGYSICNRLKKGSPALPVVIVSSGETPDTFEQHQRHQNHANLYLLRDQGAPFLADQILKLLGGGPAPPLPGDDSELDAVLGTLTAEPARTPAASRRRRRRAGWRTR